MTDSVPIAVHKKRKPIRRKRRANPAPQCPTLRFSPYAWAKLLFLRDLGGTEVGGFGISAEDDPLLIEDVRLIGQQTTVVSVEFDDEAVADFFDEQIDVGLPPERFFRLWLHTHPGDSAEPSSVDEETFERVFGRCDWAVMAILAQEGQTYARLRFNAGPGGKFEIPMRVDYKQPFPAADPDGWRREYQRCVHAMDVWHASQWFDGNGHGWPELDTDDILELLQDGRIDDDEFGSLFAAERVGAARETEEHDGDGDRRGGDRSPGRHPAFGTRCVAPAID